MATDQEALILQVSADVTRLQKQFDKAAGIVNDGAGKMEKRAKGLASSVEQAFEMPNVEKSLQKVFDSARFATFEEGGAKLRIFGSALEPLGGLGLGAAAGLAAVGIAVEQAMKVAEFADQLEEVSKKLGISTDDLQKWDFIATQTAIPVNAMRDSLGALNKNIGLVQSGLAKTQLTRAFAALDITPDQLRRLGDVSNILPVIVERAAKLNSSERAGVGERLGVTPDVLNGLIAERDRLGELNAEAEKYGIIIDKSVIARSAEAADKLKFASDIIDKNLKVAFAGLTDEIAGAALALAKFLHLLAALPQSKTEAGAKYAVMGALGQALNMPGLLGSSIHGDAQAQRLALTPSVASLKAGIAEMLNQPGAAKALVPPTGGHKGPADQTDQLTKTADEDLYAAKKALAEAYIALTGDIDQATQLQVDANNDEAAAKQAKLKADLDSLLKNNTIDGKDSDILQAKIELAQTDTELARVAKEQKILRDAELAQQEKIVADQEEIGRYYDQISDINAKLADTQAQRAEIERKRLLADQRLEREALQTDINRRLQLPATDKSHLTASGADALTAALSDKQAAELKGFNQDHLQPLDAFILQMNRDIGDLNIQFQNIAVQGLQSFTQGIAEAIVNGKSLGSVFGSVLKQIATQLLTLGIEKYLTAPLANALGLSPGTGGGGGGIGSFFSNAFSFLGFADGTSYAPGGLAMVGERGPELVNLPRGSQVIPAPQTSQLLNGGRGSVHITADFRGAVVTQDLIDSFNEMVHNVSTSVVAAHAPEIAQAGARQAQASLARRAYNLIR